MNTIRGIVAYDDNHCMGRSTGGLPWHISDDLKWFKAETIGHTVIMGRKTWESLPKAPLNFRKNLVISRSVIDSLNSVSFSRQTLDIYPHPKYSDVLICSNIRIALATTKSKFPNFNVFLIGGAQLFKSALEDNLIDELLVTKVHGVHQGDIFFPPLPVGGINWQIQTTFRSEQFDRMVFTRS